MGIVLVAGGIVGTGVGSALFRWLQRVGQIDTVIAVLYVLLLGSIGILMLRESLSALGHNVFSDRKPITIRRHHPLIAALPGRFRFYRSGLYISPLGPLLLGFATGMLTVFLGDGGGFVMVPAMIYLLGMSTAVVVGTSLFQIVFVTAAATLVHATWSRTVDIVLAGLLLLGSVVGAQLGARAAGKVKAEYLRLGLAILVLLVAARVAIGLGWRPDEIFTIQGPDA